MYPLVFDTIFKDKIWGGQKIKTLLGKDFAPLPNCGETWEISGVKGNVSVVSNGPLAGRDLASLVEEYQEKLVGKKVYSRFGNEFPLLIKFIDANDDLSIQVHPDDSLAAARHNSFGKTEMWYILQADKGARLNTGFNKEISEEIYLKHLHENTLDQILNFETVQAGDVFFLPAGRVHYIGKGVFLAEIQQTSDITYRIYDFDRVDAAGQKRELHTDLALAAIDYTHHSEYKTVYQTEKNTTTSLIECPYFTTNLVVLDKPVSRSYEALDSFVIFICTEGAGKLRYENDVVEFKLGHSILLPASIKNVEFIPFPSAKLLEVFIS
jgi:mannose-6-phosphate isomerase